MTVSARAMTVGGTAMPSFLATSTLLISSKAVGCCIGRSLGLRNPAQLEKREGKLPAWVRAQYVDAEGRVWKELDLVQLAQHPDFLGVGT